MARQNDPRHFRLYGSPCADYMKPTRYFPDKTPDLTGLFGGQHHVHRAAFHFGMLFHDGKSAGLLGDLIQHFPSHAGQGDLPSSKNNRDLDFIFLFEKTLNMAELDFQVMFIGLWTDFDFFDLKRGLLFFGFLLFFGLLVFETAVIHNFTDRRRCRGGDFNQIKPGFFGGCYGLMNRNNTALVALGIDQPHLFDFDFPVYSGFVAVLFLLNYLPTSCCMWTPF